MLAPTNSFFAFFTTWITVFTQILLPFQRAETALRCKNQMTHSFYLSQYVYFQRNSRNISHLLSSLSRTRIYFFAALVLNASHKIFKTRLTVSAKRAAFAFISEQCSGENAEHVRLGAELLSGLESSPLFGFILSSFHPLFRFRLPLSFSPSSPSWSIFTSCFLQKG